MVYKALLDLTPVSSLRPNLFSAVQSWWPFPPTAECIMIPPVPGQLHIPGLPPGALSPLGSVESGLLLVIQISACAHPLP